MRVAVGERAGRAERRLLRLAGLMSHLASADVRRRADVAAARAVRRGVRRGCRRARATSPTARARWGGRRPLGRRALRDRASTGSRRSATIRRRTGCGRPCASRATSRRSSGSSRGGRRLRPAVRGRPADLDRAGAGRLRRRRARGCCRGGWTCWCGGRRRRVVATISMDQLTFVIGDQCDVEPGDEVVLIGAAGGRDGSARRSGPAGRTRSATRSSPTSRRGAGGSSISSSEAELERLRAAVPLDGAWLVGGSVRDLLVGRPVADIDVMVDGDPGAAARGLASQAGGVAVPAVGAPRRLAGGAGRDGRSTSRAPGAPSTEDLGLRDFTINAMAMPLAGGELVDPHGGRADLDAGLRAGGQRPDLRRRPAAAAAGGPDRPRSWGS